MKFERTKKEAKARKKFEPEREKYEREEREKQEQEEREWLEKKKEEKRLYLKKQFEYLQKVYGVKNINLKLAKMNSDEYEIYKARKYVRKENLNGHKCYNGIEGKKLWINREQWKLRRRNDIQRISNGEKNI